MMDQSWFEMAELRRRRFNTAVWIPLRAAQKESHGEFGRLGYREQFFGATSMAVPLERTARAETLDWTHIGLSHTHRGGFDGGRYVPADIFDGYGLDLDAVALAMVQEGNTEDAAEWHLHQDFAITLRLKREGDLWLATEEGYIEVVRLKRNDKGRPILLEVRAEQLKDYLCARGMALYVCSYRNREEVVADVAHIVWEKDCLREVSGGDRWEGRLLEITDGGRIFGSSTRVMHVGREGVDIEEECPPRSRIRVRCRAEPRSRTTRCPTKSARRVECEKLRVFFHLRGWPC